MRKFDYFWCSKKEWYHYEDLIRVVNDDAPKEAQESYKHFLEQQKEVKNTDWPLLEIKAFFLC